MSSKTTHEKEHIPQTSADDYEYIDSRGIKIADSHWDCPNCGNNGMLMHRPGSKNTCANCFWVIGGVNNDYVLNDWPLLYRDAQRLLAAMNETWHGTPGSVGTELYRLFDSKTEVETKFKQIVGNTPEQNEQQDTKHTSLTDFV